MSGEVLVRRRWVCNLYFIPWMLMSQWILQCTKVLGVLARPIQLRQLAWVRADGAAWLQAHGLTCITLLSAHLHACRRAGLHTLGAALADAGLHALGGAVGRALGGTGLYAGIDACGGTDLDALRAAGLHALGGALGGALGAAGLHALGGTACGALGGTGSRADFHTLRGTDLHALRGAWLHADVAAGLHAHCLAGLHTLVAFLHADGRGQAGLLALLVVRHPSGVLAKLEAKTRERQDQDICLFSVSHSSQPKPLKHK